MGGGSDGAAGIVLAGGRSSRMGTSKAALDWHGSTLLHRTTALLSRTVDGPVVVVASPGQDLPDLPAGVAVVRDPVEGLGPMQGIAAGLAAVADRAPTAFVCSTDLPFLHPAFVRRVLRDLTEPGPDITLPVVGGYRQPLAAGYRTSLAGLISTLLRDGQQRPGMLFRHCRVRQLPDSDLLADAELARLDPELASVVNVNAPDDYAAALAQEPAEVALQCVGTLACGGRCGARTAHVAILGAAAHALDLTLDRHVVATLNGEPVAGDERLPLVAGDSVVFRPATDQS